MYNGHTCGPHIVVFQKNLTGNQLLFRQRRAMSFLSFKANYFLRYTIKSSLILFNTTPRINLDRQLVYNKVSCV